MGSTHSTLSSTHSAAEINEKLAGELTESLGSLTVSNPVSENGAITKDNVDGWEDKLANDPKTVLARNIFVDTDFKSALATRSARIADPHIFNLSLDFKTGPITNQKSSGRCWLFATTNVLRHSVMQKLDLEEFQLSQVRSYTRVLSEEWKLIPNLQSYPFFWDKLNKCNYFLELAIETANLPLDDRVVSHLNDEVISDGGQWDMAVNLLEVSTKSSHKWWKKKPLPFF